ncbi:hypothetical protein L2E82_04462 [Cichorium intybus]|uniref:Uncharacterized protein n=1 Tax=Cichorium intybus TaxID=13427 RepID=A0ACB9H5H5_CICIN|nr:hypothetical protein L2E82_04462 [Cichorium intybus]
MKNGKSGNESSIVQNGTNGTNLEEDGFDLTSKSSLMMESVEPISPDLKLQAETHEIRSSADHNSSKKVNEISIANESIQIQQFGVREMNFLGISIPSEPDNQTVTGIGLSDVDCTKNGHNFTNYSGLVGYDSIIDVDNPEFVHLSIENSIDSDKQLKVDDDSIDSDCDNVMEKGIAKKKLGPDCSDMLLEESKNRDKLVDCTIVDPNVVLDFDSIDDNIRKDKDLNLKAGDFYLNSSDGQGANGSVLHGTCNQTEFGIDYGPDQQENGDQIKMGNEGMTDSSIEKHFPVLNSSSDLANKHINFLNLDWKGNKSEIVTIDIDKKKPTVNSKQTNDTKSFAETVNTNHNSISANIKLIPKLFGTKVGEVEMPYSNVMLGSVPYHSTLYGFFC